MIKSKLAVIFDSLLISFIIFILFYFWINKFIKNAFLSLFCSILLSFIVFFIIFKFSLKKFKLNKIKFKDQALAKDTMLKIKFMDIKTLSTYLKNLLNVNYIDQNIFENNNAIFYINTRVPLNEKDFYCALDYFNSKDNSNKSLFFICSSITNEFKNLLELYPTKFGMFYEVDLFLIIKEKNYFPNSQSETNQKTNKFNSIKSKLSNSVSKSHFKEFFFSGLSLILLASIIPFSLYYLIFGTFLLILSLVSLFIKNKNQTMKQTSTDSLSTLIKDVTSK